ncbi:MAG: hypothetical protein GY773_24840 [Actinomycetia bacterium]|nr:hypothetical protein [Actinomycetes bacterium]
MHRGLGTVIKESWLNNAALSVAVTVMVLAAACGSDAQGGSEGTQPASPVASFLGEETVAGDEGSLSRYLIREQERQEQISDCMGDLGFEYTPVDLARFTSFGSPDQPIRGSEAWVARYGFGITTTWLTQDEVGPDLIGREPTPNPDTAPGAEIEAGTGPSFDQMTAAEQEAYNTALYGPSGDTIGAQPGGCEGEASAAVGGTAHSFYEEFGDELDAIYQQAAADPRLTQLPTSVSDCITSQGFEYTSEEAVYQRFNRELVALEPAMSHPADDLSDEDFATMSSEDLDAVLSQPRTLSPEGLTILATLQADEIELALVVNECGGGIEAQNETFRQIVLEYEQQFLDDNRDRLATFEAGG